MPTPTPQTALDRRDAVRANYLRPGDMRHPQTLEEADTGIAAIEQSLAACELSLGCSRRESFLSDESFAAWRIGAETACRTYRETLTRWRYYREVLRTPTDNPYAKSARFLRVEDMRVPETVAEAEAAVTALRAAIASSGASIERLTRRMEAEARGETVGGVVPDPHALTRARDALSRYESALPSMQYHLVVLRGRQLGVAAAVRALIEALPREVLAQPAVHDAAVDVAFVLDLPTAPTGEGAAFEAEMHRNAA